MSRFVKLRIVMVRCGEAGLVKAGKVRFGESCRVRLRSGKAGEVWHREAGCVGVLCVVFW